MAHGCIYVRDLRPGTYPASLHVGHLRKEHCTRQSLLLGEPVPNNAKLFPHRLQQRDTP